MKLYTIINNDKEKKSYNKTKKCVFSCKYRIP